MSLAVGEYDIRLDTAGAIDVEKEKTRLTKELVDIDRFISGLSKKLDNAEFIKNAPPAVVEGERRKFLEATEKSIRLHKELESLT
jgi:valyl-tRNA synthetase